MNSRFAFVPWFCLLLLPPAAAVAGETRWFAAREEVHDMKSCLLAFYQGDVAQRTLDTAAREAKDNLDTFWLVGVIEQYKGFIAVLKHMMDPLKRYINT